MHLYIADDICCGADGNTILYTRQQILNQVDAQKKQFT